MVDASFNLRDHVVRLGRREGLWEIKAAALGVRLERTNRFRYRVFRNAMGRTYGRHRRFWLARTRIKFGPKGEGMQVEQKTTAKTTFPGKDFNRRRTFFYRVYPATKSVPKGMDPERAIDAIRGEAFSFSKPALGLEQGGTVRPKGGGQSLTIPIGITLDSQGRAKSRWNTPARYKRFGKNKLLALQFPGEKSPKLYQVHSARKRSLGGEYGAFTTRGARASERRLLIPAYQIIDRAKRDKLLRFMDAWDQESKGLSVPWNDAMDDIDRYWRHGIARARGADN